MNPDFIKDDQALNESLNNSFVSSEKQFKGIKLNKFTLGLRVILNQIREEGDSTEFFVWSTLFCLITPRNQLIKLAWDKTKFREAVIDWSDSLVEQDFMDGVKLIDEIYAELADARVTSIGRQADPKA